MLERSVRSVLEQTYPRFELIIVDDGSDDGTGDMVRSFRDDRITYLYQENKGVSSARNLGLLEATGDFIALLDSDDRWTRDKLRIAHDHILCMPETRIFHTNEIWYRRGVLLPQMEKHRKPSGRVYRNALTICCISISTAVISRSVFDDIGTFDESLEACEDYDFWLRATSRYEVALIPDALTIKDGGRPDQLSLKIWGLDRFRIKALEKMMRTPGLAPEEYRWTFEQLHKKCRIFANGAGKRGNTELKAYYEKLPEKYRREH